MEEDSLVREKEKSDDDYRLNCLCVKKRSFCSYSYLWCRKGFLSVKLYAATRLSFRVC